MKRIPASLLLATLAAPLAPISYAADLDFGFGIDITRSNIKLDNDTLRTSDFVDDDQDAIGGSGYAKMRVNKGLVADVGFTHGSNTIFGSTFDHYSYDGVFLRAGYEWLVGKNFSITPQLGLQHTRLYFTEGIFLNPGEEEEIRMTSTRPIVGLKLGVPFGKTFAMHYRIQHTDFNDGSLMQQTIGFSFMLW